VMMMMLMMMMILRNILTEDEEQEQVWRRFLDFLQFWHPFLPCDIWQFLWYPHTNSCDHPLRVLTQRGEGTNMGAASP
jgi:hypothetical protein